MKYNVKWLIQAAQDLQNIREYLDLEAPVQSKKNVSLIYNEINHPLSFLSHETSISIISDNSQVSNDIVDVLV